MYGRFVYVVTPTNYITPPNHGVTVYSIGPGGGLIPVTGPAIVTGGASHSIAITSNGKNAYVVNSGSHSISQYTLAATGALVPMVPATIGTGAVGPLFIAIDPAGANAYVTNNYNGSISQYSIGPSGALSSILPAVPAGAYPRNIAVDPFSQFVYSVNDGVNDVVHQFAINAGGALTALSPAPAPTGLGNSGNSVAIDPSGQYVYVTNDIDNTVSQYSIGAGGELTPL